MREELRSYISLYYGPSAWDQIVSIEADMRKKRKEEMYAAEERKQKILEWVAGIAAALFATAVMAAIIYGIGVYQGKW